MTDEFIETTEQDDRFRVMATKVSAEAREAFTKICAAKGMSPYELLQIVIDTLIRYMDDRHNLTPEMEQAMSIFEHLEGWKDAFNLADPTTQPEITEATYYLRDPEKKGVRGVHVETPFMGDWGMTYNIQEILEKTINLLMPERYKRLRLLAVDNNCSSILQLVDQLIDEHSKDADVAAMRQGFEDANRSDYGKKPADSPFKRKHYKTVNDYRLTNPQLFDMEDGDDLLNGI